MTPTSRPTLTLSTDVSGIVASIPVHEGEAVKQGQVLFRLDPLKFQIALDNAQANLAQTRLNLEAMKADYQAALRDTAAKQAQVNADQATYDRLAALVKQHAVSQQETDDARYKLAADQRRWAPAHSRRAANWPGWPGNPNCRPRTCRPTAGPGASGRGAARAGPLRRARAV